MSANRNSVLAGILSPFILMGAVWAQPQKAPPPKGIHTVGQIGGVCRYVEVQGNSAYALIGPNLEVLDIGDPAAPIPIGKILLEEDLYEEFRGIAHIGTRVLMPNAQSAPFVVDVRVPQNPTLGATVETPDRVWSAVTSGTLAFLAGGFAGLVIADFSDPSSPTVRATLDMPDAAFDVDVSDDLAFVLAGQALEIVDVGDHSAPAAIGEYAFPGFYAESVVVGGHRVFVQSPFGETRVLDVSDPTSPVLEGQFIGLFEVARVEDNLIYFIGGLGFGIMDTNRPPDPWSLLPWGVVGRYECGTWISDLCKRGDFVYLAASQGGFEIVDVSNLTTPVLAGKYHPPSSSMVVRVAGDYAYVPDGWAGGGLHIVDVSDATAPKNRGRYFTWPQVTDVELTSGVAFVSGPTYTPVFDVSDPWNPTPLSVPGFLRGADTELEGDVLYVLWSNGMTTESGIRIVDVHDIQSPILLGDWVTSGLAYVTAYSASVLAVSGDLACMVLSGRTSEEGVLVFVDVSDPASPAEVSRFPVAYRIHDIFIRDHVVYVGWSKSRTGDPLIPPSFAHGLQTIDVKDPSAPVLLGDRALRIWPEAVFVSDGAAYLAGLGWGNVQVLDVRDPSSPALRGWFTTPSGRAKDVFVSDGLIYVAAEDDGLWILEFTGLLTRTVEWDSYR